MADLGELLRQAVGDVPTDGGSIDDLAHRADRHRRRQRAGGVLAAVAVVVAAMSVTSGRNRDTIQVVGQPETVGGQPVFSTPTGVALLFDDGYDGIAALDLDTGVVGRRVVEGQRAGDQPYRLFRSGDSLIVGWREVFAAPLDGGPSVLLGEATLAAPAVEPGRVWLYVWSGGSVGDGELTLRRVDLHGNVEKSELAPSTADFISPPAPEGVPLEDSGGLFRGKALAGGPDLIVTTCDPFCENITVRRRGEPVLTFPLPAGISLADIPPQDVAFSPDGSRMAFLTAAPGSRLLVVDLERGGLVADQSVDDYSSATWSPDGRQLFWTTNSYGESSTVVGHIDMASGAVEFRRLAFGGNIRALAVSRAEAASFLPESPAADPGSCPPPAIQPSNRTGLCGFRVTGGANVVVPDVLGVDASVAEARLTDLGLTLAAAAGDPREIGAVVVSQDPAGGATTGRGASVRVRTSVIDPRLCAALAGATPGAGDRLLQARPLAPTGLAADIDTVLTEIDAGRDPAAVPEAADRIGIAIAACGRS